MEDILTKAARVQRKLRQGMKIKPGEGMEPALGLSQACISRDRLEGYMRDEELLAEDSATGIVFACGPDFTGGRFMRLYHGRENEVLNEMMQCKARVYGVVFAIRDREKPERRIWAHPVCTTKDALEMLSIALDKQASAEMMN